jgi:hypothetical protein
VKIFLVHGMRVGQWPVILWVMGCIFFIPWAAWSETALTASEPKLSASIEKSAAMVGDRLWLTLMYDLPQGTHFPDDSAIQGIEKLAVVERTARKGEIKIRFLVDQLESFNIGPISLTYLDKNGNERTIKAGPVAITVLSNLGKKPEEATLKPIQDIIPTTSIWMPYLPWAAVAGMLLSVVIGWLWRLRKHRPSEITAAMVDPPHVRAEKAIDQLMAGKLFEKGDVKTFYFNFSEIIRRYMASIRPFPAAEMTIEEIVPHARTNAHDQQILPLLRQADLVKFADAVPTLDRKAQDVQAARAYIRQTCSAPDNAPGVQSGLEAEP